MPMKILKLFRPFAHVFGAMVSLILLSNLLSLGAFAVPSLPSILPLALLLAGSAWLIYLVLSASISACISLSEPGILIMLVVGIIAGATATTFTSLLRPGSVLLTSFWAAIPYSAAGTVLTWVFAYSTGSLKKNLTFLPKR